MRIHGVLLVRDGVDSLRLCLVHHLMLGIERIHVVDNGSTDGTLEVLRRLARRTPITWTSAPGPYHQHVVVTELVHEAARQGADWVVPFDHDEFWVSGGRPLRDALAEADGAAAVSVPMVTFAQRRGVKRSRARALLTMEHRAERTVEPVEAQELVEAGRLSFLEYRYPPKLIFRASTTVDVQRGAHWSRNLDAADVATAPGLEILHAPLPARDALERKAEHGARLIDAGYIEREGWHVRRWARLERDGGLDGEWATLSVDRDGCIEVGGERRRFVRDTRLRDSIAWLVRSPVAQAAARALRRSW
jgi:glycosyltransferase involved in cell wall biosynthesis